MWSRNTVKGRRARRRARTVQVEGLEDRTLLSTTQGANFVPGEVLVQYRPGVTLVSQVQARGSVGAAANAAEAIDATTMRAAGLGKLELIHLPVNGSVETSIQALRANPNVAYAEPNWIYTTDAVSNDPYYTTNSRLWGMYSNDQPSAVGPSGTTNPYGSQAEKAWAAGATGSNQIYVGIIDEGVQYTHPDLSANVWTNPYETPNDGIDNDGNGYVDDVHGWDFDGNNNTIYDGTQDDHGTHVAGTIGAQGGNGQGVAGVNWNVTYIDAKFLGRRGGTTANAIKAVDYFTDLKTRHDLNIVALNNSWGGGGYSQGLLDAITRAAKANILFIAAAGNGGSDGIGDNNDSVASYPSNYNTTAGTSTEPAASYDSVVAVAAIDANGNLAGFSNYGATTVDLGAPGVNIYSTLPTNSYGSYSGTSMATPHVTGAAALYAANYLNANGSVPSAETIKQALLNTAIPTASLSGKTVTGGRLDAFGALSYNPNPTDPPADPTGLQGTVVSSSDILLRWTDNSSTEQGFRVQQKINGTFQTIASTGANSTSYEVTGLSPQTSYDFQVIAYNSVGDSAPTTASAMTAASVSIPYTDHFNSNPKTPGSVWAFSGTQWDYNATDGILQQTSQADTSVERRAMMVGVNGVPTEVRAKVRVDSWQAGEYARAGVSLATDPRTTQGYSLVFTGRNSDGTHIEFVNDYVAWSGWPTSGGVTVPYNMQVGTWYMFDMRLDNGTLYGKVWPAGTTEPTSWTITYDAASHGWNRSGGVVALNGSSAGTFQDQGRSFATASYDDVWAAIAGTQPPPPDAAPTVAITNPSDGATVSGNVNIMANATDDNAVNQVEFFANGQSLGVDTNGADGWSVPVPWDSTTAADGSATITATATDNANQSSSQTIHVTVDNVDDPPTVAITSPAAGAVVQGGSVALTASASDDRGVKQVEFFVDGTSVGVDSNGADGWSVAWNSTTVGDGAHSLTAVATDTASQSSPSGAVALTVDNTAPSVAITSPTGGSTVSGTQVVTASASDATSGVAQVAFYVDGTLIGVDTNSADGWSVSWNTTTVANGSHNLTAVATDRGGLTTTSAAVATTVQNANPNAMYVWDIAWSDRVRRQRGSYVMDLTMTVDINRDSNANGQAESGDAAVSGASVGLLLIYDANNDGFDSNDQSWTFQGTTDSNGLVSFSQRVQADSGSFQATVTSLTRSGNTWAPSLDAANPSSHDVTGSAGGGKGHGGGLGGNFASGGQGSDGGGSNGAFGSGGIVFVVPENEGMIQVLDLASDRKRGRSR